MRFGVEFNRITAPIKDGTRYKRLVKGDSFICNTKIHSIQNE